MRTVFTIIGLTLTFSTAVLADVPTHLRASPKEHKLVIHTCEVSPGDRINSLFKESEQFLNLANCSIASDINYSNALDQLSKKYDDPFIRSVETVDVKKGVDQGSGKVTGPIYWKTCDAEDNNCIGWSNGGFKNSVEKIFIISPDQQEAILEKLIKNKNQTNTNIYFFRHAVNIKRFSSESLFTYYYLKGSALFVK